MEYTDVERDLRFIRQTMETSLRYTNIPALGYLVGGAVGVLTVLLTYTIIGKELAADLDSLSQGQVIALTLIWFSVFLLTVFCVMKLIVKRAQAHDISAWDSLAARMYLSQAPLVFIAGTLTLGLGLKGTVSLVPTVWLLSFGVALISFSYFTSVLQRVEGVIFIILGTLTVLLPGSATLVLLGLGFGGVLTVSGVIRFFKNGAFI